MNYFVIIQFGFSFGTALALAAIHVSTIAIGQEVSFCQEANFHSVDNLIFNGT